DPWRFCLVIAGAQKVLGDLGFGTGPFDGALDAKTKKALLKYQELHKLPQTGELDARTSVELDADLDALFYSEAVTPSLSVNLQLWASGYVSAEGTWLPAGVSFTRFPQTTVLHCYKDLQTCFEATTVLSDLASDKYLST